MSGLSYSEAPDGSAMHRWMQKSCPRLLNTIAKALCSLRQRGLVPPGVFTAGVLPERRRVVSGVCGGW